MLLFDVRLKSNIYILLLFIIFILILLVFSKYSQRYSSQVIFTAASVIDMHMTYMTDVTASFLFWPLLRSEITFIHGWLAF